MGAVIIRDVQRGLSDRGFGGAIQAAAERAPLSVIVERLPAEGSR
jgi:hypothetical protein